MRTAYLLVYNLVRAVAYLAGSFRFSTGKLFVMCTSHTGPPSLLTASNKARCLADQLLPVHITNKGPPSLLTASDKARCLANQLPQDLLMHFCLIFLYR